MIQYQIEQQFSPMDGDYLAIQAWEHGVYIKTVAMVTAAFEDLDDDGNIGAGLRHQAALICFALNRYAEESDLAKVIAPGLIEPMPIDPPAPMDYQQY